ncbi:Tetratricopeptide repeat-containing protein [Geosporobacter subterraneus DSM 17957]|uniref:Tetratricopeptide repeat-containing protein n=1 Tax=Geosporobacter subterraneus DSM 17957 TaxID=1121919 RepID=A0A1M6MQT3_9FIRM|nr:rhomboid family intramembrane serine protease [Geosporobacter subterraneus]SHJ85720.1 Tetratricopeptide repeat-containing protein [Geosporobacter subterraneus DSM 17957]
MIIQHTVWMTKYLIEDKEFFLYLRKPVEDVFDLVLHKQLWREKYYLGFIDGDRFLSSSLDYQKSILHNLYSEIKMKNRFSKLFFYHIILLDRDYSQYELDQLEQLYVWVRNENIHLNLMFYPISSGQVFTLFSNFEDSEHIAAALSAYMPTLPHDAAEPVDLLEIERNTRKSKGYDLGQKRFYLTNVLIAINLLYWFYMSVKGSTTDIYHLIEYGAKYNPLIANGEYYRLVSSMFIHIGLPHLLLNTYALNILGRDVELIYGSIKFLIIYLIAGIFGSLGSFLFSSALSAGASGAIFGLMGAYLYFGLRKPAIFSARYGMNLVTLLIINIVFGLVNANIDNFAHMGGLIGGFSACWALGFHKEKPFTRRRILLQLVIISFIVISLLMGISIHQNTSEYHLHKGVNYLRQNDYSNARQQFEAGLSANPNVWEFYFYLAFIAYNEGDQKGAIAYLEKTLELNPHEPMARNFLQELQQQ